MKKIIKILMERDGISYEEALKMAKDIQFMIMNVLDDGGDYDDVQDLLESKLGLEMDHVMDLI